MQATGADAVCSLFVFLNLLECQAEFPGKRFLAHVEHETAHSDALADVPVDRTGRSCLNHFF
jgi:hypothetical protein